MSTTWHQEVRNRNRELLVQAGKEVLIEKGFQNVSHQDVCDRANLSKVTFYKLFNSMDELIFAIQIKVLAEIGEYIASRNHTKKTGLESVEGYVDTWIDLLKTHAGHLKFIGFFDHAYSDSYPSEKLKTAYREDLLEVGLGKMLSSFISQGISDGSIRPDIPEKKVILYIYEMLVSLTQRLASRGQLLEDEHGYSTLEVAGMSKEFVIQYLNNGK